MSSLRKGHANVVPISAYVLPKQAPSSNLSTTKSKILPGHLFFFFLGLGLGDFFFNLFIYFWLCWVFVSVQGLSPVAVSGGHSSLQCAGLSLSRPLLLRSTGSRRAGSVIVAHGPSCSVACGIFPDQGSNLCPLNWQADSQPLRHQGSPSWSSLIPLSPLPSHPILHKSCGFTFKMRF